MRKIAKKLFSATVLSLLVSSALASQKPEKTQGLEVTPLQLHNLKMQIPVMAGYELRTRSIVIKPGGTIAEHSHSDRPGVVYVLKGSMTEHRGDVSRVVNVGDTWTESFDTMHWMENTSGKPCTILAVDLVVKK
jgi:quercetin dioxygenase-like cupin family protein